MVHRRRLLFSFFFVLPCLVFGQDENAIATFKGLLHDGTRSPAEESLQDTELQIDQARESNDALAEITSRRLLGLVYLTRVHDYERALDHFITALAIADSVHLKDQQLLTYVAMARVFEVVGDYHKSAQLLSKALDINRGSRHIDADALILNNLGRVNAARGRLNEAFENYRQVLRYQDYIGKSYEAEALFNLGHLFALQGEYDQALDYHRAALRVNRTLGDKQAEARSLNDIGILYDRMQNDNKSGANHQVALEIRQRLGDGRGLAESHNNIAALHLKAGETADAISHALQALEHGREAQSRELMLQSYELLSQGYKETGDFRNALVQLELGVALQELIAAEKQERQLLEAQNRYVIATKESQIQELDALRLEREREIDAQRKSRNILFLVAVLVFLSAALLFVLYLVKRRSNMRLQAARKEVEAKNQKLQELNNTKDKFFSIISHDLKGPLNSLTSFSGLLINHTDSLSREEIQLLAKDLDKSVRNLLTLLENLLAWSRSQTGNIDFTPEVLPLNELLMSNKALLQTQADTKGIAVEIDCDVNLTVRLHKNSVNTVVRNLISNSIKFTPSGGAIRISVTTDSEVLRLAISDTGVGMSRDAMDKVFQLGTKHSTSGTANEKGTGLGLVLCREFVERNGGRINVRSEIGKGSVFTCAFPYARTVVSTKVVNVTAISS